jgi:hypothetical protein
MAYFKSKIRYFLYGVGSLVSIFPNVADLTAPRPRYYKPAKSVEEAFIADWSRLGYDMDKAVKSV